MGPGGRSTRERQLHLVVNSIRAMGEEAERRGRGKRSGDMGKGRLNGIVAGGAGSVNL